MNKPVKWTLIWEKPGKWKISGNIYDYTEIPFVQSGLN